MGLLMSGTLRTLCGASVDTRVALGGGDTGSCHTEKRATAPTSPKIIYKLRATHCLTAPQSVISVAVVSPPSATRASTDAPHHVLNVPFLRRPTEAQIREPVQIEI